MKLLIITKKILCHYYKQLLLVCGLFSITPYFVVSFFNNPSYIDDYCFSNRAIILGFWEAQKNHFLTINGRYASTLILSLDIVNPSNNIYFKLFPIALMLFLIIALYILIHRFFNTKKTGFKLAITLGVFILYVSSMPILSEGFYWWSSAIAYQLANILSLLFIALIIDINKKNNIYKTILGIILLFFLVGFNECNLIAINLFIVINFINKYYNEKRINFHLFFINIFSIFFSAITILAPGNYIRMAKNDNTQNFILSFFLSLGQLGWSFLTWSGLIILFSIVIYPFLFSEIDNNKNFKSNYKILLLSICLIAFSMFLIGFLAQGEPLPPRARNSVYLFFMLGLIYTTLIYVHTSESFKNFSLSKNKKISFALSICLVSIVYSKENFTETVKDVVKLKAYKFDNEMKERVNILINNKKGNTPNLKPIENKPHSIFFNEFEYNNENRRECIYTYFSK